MSDVAHAAGVSLVTVSRAINTPDKVSPETLQRVRQAIRHLGYVPNLTAGSLASNRSNIVAAIVPTLSNLVFSETVDALADTLAHSGYQLLLGQSAYSADEEAALVDAFLGRRVDGLVLTGLSQSAALRVKLRRSGIPVVQTWDFPSSPNQNDPIDMLVGFSNIEVGRAAARHLLSRGHARLAFIGSDEERSRLRLSGFEAEAREQDAQAVEVALIPPPVSVNDAGRILEGILARNPGVSAVFCNNDLLATGLLFTCLKNGWPVPGRMAVMGFGDLSLSRATSPSLSTIRIHHTELGKRAGKLLLSRLSGKRVVRARQDIGFRIMQRSST